MPGRKPPRDGQQHPGDGQDHARRKGRRIQVLFMATTRAGDPFLLTEARMLISALEAAGAATIDVQGAVALAEFRYRTASAEKAADTAAARFNRPLTVTAVVFLARSVDERKVEFSLRTPDWPDELPEFPDPRQGGYHWTSPDAHKWEVL